MPRVMEVIPKTMQAGCDRIVDWTISSKAENIAVVAYRNVHIDYFPKPRIRIFRVGDRSSLFEGTAQEYLTWS